MKEIALHLLDLAENSTAAGAANIEIQVCEDLVADRLTAIVEDDGSGMDAATVHKVIDPFYSSRITRKIGLGIPLLKEAAETCGGSFTINSVPGIGTKVSASWQYSHIDRMPLGSLATTFLELLSMHPDVHWIFRYTVRLAGAKRTFEFNDQLYKEVLGEVSLTHPKVITFFRESLENGLAETREILNP